MTIKVHISVKLKIFNKLKKYLTKTCDMYSQSTLSPINNEYKNHQIMIEFAFLF